MPSSPVKAPPPSGEGHVTNFIRQRIEQGLPPTRSEICAEFGWDSKNTAADMLNALEKKGYIRRHEGSSRGICLVNKSEATSLPIVGVVRAGALQPAIEDIEGYFSIDRSQLRGGGAFFLRVKGDSMINAHIQEGDLALVRPQPTAEPRDIVVAMVSGEATLKRFYREQNHVRLQPENPNYSPIIIGRDAAEAAIIGKVVGIFRDFM